ncbi:MAG: flagellar biosynthetic protein FliR [Limnobacter sp.]|uniref:flagellar biosynthetic protein FliR n=1 Tax=Limnobacter sp. TaxID=2003368 RepID=UPI00391B0704
MGANSWAPVLMRMVSDQILFGVLLSAPVLLAVLVVEVAFEIVSAFTQQLQVYNLEYGLRSVMGIGMALLLLHVAQDEIISQFSAYSRALTRLLENAL